MKRGAIRENAPRIALLLDTLGDNGASIMLWRLAVGMTQRGVSVDLLSRDVAESYRHTPPGTAADGPRLIGLRSTHALWSVPSLASYLRRERPAAVLVSDKLRTNLALLRARRLAGTPTRLGLRASIHLSRELQLCSVAKRRRRLQRMRRVYPEFDPLIAVSRGVADDMAAIAGNDRERIQVLPNPVITREFLQQAAEPLSDPWFAPGAPPVILGVGRLEQQKDFPTLLRAFALLRRQRPCRLLILGEGSRRAELQALVQRLGVGADCRLPGYSPNPYPFMAQASVFVVSSAWEGIVNVLTEALALGTPAVATDCPSGPREILRNGELGLLVPVGDDAALADAIQATLEHPPEAARLRAGVAAYTLDASVDAYLQALGVAIR